MAGVEVGDGAIIAANATVTNEVAPYSVVGGNPAREIRKRFFDEQVSELLRIRWDWDLEKISKNVHLLTSNNIEYLRSLA